MNPTEVLLRMKAYDHFIRVKNSGKPIKSVIQELSHQYEIPEENFYRWNSGKTPVGRKGAIQYNSELLYVIGAILGDGCLYRYKPNNNHVIVVGDEQFTAKYASKAFLCTGSYRKNYIVRSKTVWTVSINNFELARLFEHSRLNVWHLKPIIYELGRDAALAFIEGFFDAEGCVKVICEKTRKTPKICLDITNTNLEYINFTRTLLKDFLNIDSNYSIQKPVLGADGHLRKKAFHLRIYKKSAIKDFLAVLSTTKMTPQKHVLTQNWLFNGR